MHRLFNKRLVTALLTSIAMHAVFLLVMSGIGRKIQKNSAQLILRVNLVLPAKVAPPVDAVMQSTHHGAFSNEGAARANIQVAPVTAHYFLYNEVDKRADFIYSAPIENLDQIGGSETKVRMKVRVFINELGIVDAVDVLESEPSNAYDEACKNALLSSRFFPAEKDGKKVKSQKILEFNYLKLKRSISVH